MFVLVSILAGWENFTNAAIKQLSDHRKGLIFLLWGVYAQKKVTLIDSTVQLKEFSTSPSSTSQSLVSLNRS
jgi:uracil-DNA glycosylase